MQNPGDTDVVSIFNNIVQPEFDYPRIISSLGITIMRMTHNIYPTVNIKMKPLLASMTWIDLKKKRRRNKEWFRTYNVDKCRNLWCGIQIRRKIRTYEVTETCANCKSLSNSADIVTYLGIWVKLRHLISCRMGLNYLSVGGLSFYANKLSCVYTVTISRISATLAILKLLIKKFLS